MKITMSSMVDVTTRDELFKEAEEEAKRNGKKPSVSRLIARVLKEHADARLEKNDG